MKKLQDFCEKHNIKLYIVFIPSHTYYYRKFDEKFQNPEGIARSELALIKTAKTKYGINIIDPEENFLKEANGHYIYFKTDHHLTDYGAYILYQQIIKEMQKDLPALTITPKSEFRHTKNNKPS